MLAAVRAAGIAMQDNIMFSVSNGGLVGDFSPEDVLMIPPRQAAARITGIINSEKLAETNCQDPSVPTMLKSASSDGKSLDHLLHLLVTYPKCDAIQTNCVWALRTLVTDDDSRGGESMVPSAVANRDYVCDRVGLHGPGGRRE